MVVRRLINAAERIKFRQRDGMFLLRADVLPGPSVRVRVRVLFEMRAEKLQKLPQLWESVY